MYHVGFCCGCLAWLNQPLLFELPGKRAFARLWAPPILVCCLFSVFLGFYVRLIRFRFWVCGWEGLGGRCTSSTASALSDFLFGGRRGYLCLGLGKVAARIESRSKRYILYSSTRKKWLVHHAFLSPIPNTFSLLPLSKMNGGRHLIFVSSPCRLSPRVLCPPLIDEMRTCTRGRSLFFLGEDPFTHTSIGTKLERHLPTRNGFSAHDTESAKGGE